MQLHDLFLTQNYSDSLGHISRTDALLELFENDSQTPGAARSDFHQSDRKGSSKCLSEEDSFQSCFCSVLMAIEVCKESEQSGTYNKAKCVIFRDTRSEAKPLSASVWRTFSLIHAEVCSVYKCTRGIHYKGLKST